MYLHYQPRLEGAAQDPEPTGGGVDRLRLWAGLRTPGEAPLADVGPAVRVAAGLYRFDLADLLPGSYTGAVQWRGGPGNLLYEDVQVLHLPGSSLVSGEEIARFLGERQLVTESTLAEAAWVASSMVAGYVGPHQYAALLDRGVPDDVRAVALAVGARVASNPAQTRALAVEGQSISPPVAALTYFEQTILNRYRRRAA